MSPAFAPMALGALCAVVGLGLVRRHPAAGAFIFLAFINFTHAGVAA